MPYTSSDMLKLIQLEAEVGATTSMNIPAEKGRLLPGQGPASPGRMDTIEMQAYIYSGACQPKKIVFALAWLIPVAAGLGFFQGTITGWLPRVNMLLDLGLAILVGGFLGKALTRGIRSADVRNTRVANAISFASIATTIYFCWIAWFSDSPDSWTWKPGDVIEKMQAVIALYPDGVIPVYFYWVYVAGIVVALAVSNNKWYHGGFCERCQEWCEPVASLGPGFWPPAPIETEDDLFESVKKAPTGGKSLILRLAQCPACKSFSTAELLKHENLGGHQRQQGLYPIQLAILDEHINGARKTHHPGNSEPPQ